MPWDSCRCCCRLFIHPCPSMITLSALSYYFQYPRELSEALQRLTVQLSSSMTASPSSPTTIPPPAPGSPCRALSRAASCANMLLYDWEYESAIYPSNPIGKAHSSSPYSGKGAIDTYRDESIAHATLSLNIVLTANLVALIHPSATVKSLWVAVVGSVRV